MSLSYIEPDSAIWPVWIQRIRRGPGASSERRGVILGRQQGQLDNTGQAVVASNPIVTSSSEYTIQRNLEIVALSLCQCDPNLPIASSFPSDRAMIAYVITQQVELTSPRGLPVALRNTTLTLTGSTMRSCVGAHPASPSASQTTSSPPHHPYDCGILLLPSKVPPRALVDDCLRKMII